MPNQQTTAAANALSGERTFETVQFATTGEPYADAISGIAIVLRTCGIQIHQAPNLLEFLFKQAAADLKRYEAMIASQQVAYPTQQYPQALGNATSGLGGQISGIANSSSGLEADKFGNINYLYRQLGLQNDPPDVP